MDDAGVVSVCVRESNDVLRKRVMSDIVDIVLVKKLLIDNPRGIRNDFIYPSAQSEFSNSIKSKQIIIIIYISNFK